VGRRVHLSERRAADRLAVELVEHLVNGTEFRLNDRLDSRPVFGRHLVLERGQLVDVRRREHVGPRGEDLSHLDERRAEVEQRLQQIRRPAALVGDRHLAAPTDEEEPAAIPGVRDREREERTEHGDEAPERP